tara:strand:- start:442 stop:1251 length:810 start_codon:yes stop_codon:yes gene_type:complete
MSHKIAISLLCLKKIEDFDSFLMYLKKEKIKLVELPITKFFHNYQIDKIKLKEFKKKLNYNKIRVSSIQAIFHGINNLTVFNQNQSLKILDHLKRVIKISKCLKTKILIFGSPKMRKLKPKNKKKQIMNAIKLFKKISKLCEKNNIKFCIEPNAKYYGCNYINSIKESLELQKKINSKNFLINVDTGNVSLEKEKLNNYFNQRNFFANFQISAKNLGDIRYSKFDHLSILRKFNLKNKVISLEMRDQKLSNLKSQIKFFKKIINKLNYV